MIQVEQNPPRDTTMKAIFAALNACYGDLAHPDFRKVYANMDGPLHRRLIDELRANDVEVRETTDQNDDVATQLVVNQGNDETGLALSGVGPFAALVELVGEGKHYWVTSTNEAPTHLAALVVKTVEQAGFSLLDRDTVMQTIAMNRADGGTEATLYQALFTDGAMVP